jgi:hypothetical protein
MHHSRTPEGTPLANLSQPIRSTVWGSRNLPPTVSQRLRLQVTPAAGRWMVGARPEHVVQVDECLLGDVEAGVRSFGISMLAWLRNHASHVQCPDSSLEPEGI